jgi:hypothetical protein
MAHVLAIMASLNTAGKYYVGNMRDGSDEASLESRERRPYLGRRA